MSEKDTSFDIDTQINRTTPLQQALASCTGALLTSFFVTPLDVVKIRLQAQQKTASRCFLYCNGLMDHLCDCSANGVNNNSNKQWYNRSGHFNGTIDAFIKISRNEGIASLWSGLSPTLVLAVPATIVYFVTYEQLRMKLKEEYNKNKTSDISQPFWIPLLSGATARIFSATLVSPIELIRTKMQSSKLSYVEIGEALKLLVRQDGVFGLWKGLFPTLLRDVPFSAIYWMNYETIKTFFGTGGAPSFWFSFMAGATAGGIAATLTVPFDVVKTHQQIAFGESLRSPDNSQGTQKTVEIIRQIYAQHGIRGLFTGLVPRLIKVAPACAIMIATFEYSKVAIARLASKKYDKSYTNESIESQSTKSKDVSNIMPVREVTVQNSTTNEFL